MTPPYLVAIGHFAQPSVVELQARAIRANCGADTPIMVSDDHSETAFDESKGHGPERGGATHGASGSHGSVETSGELLQPLHPAQLCARHRTS